VTWKPYEEVYGTKHTVVGDVRVMQNVSSSGLKPRNILVYLPPNYELETRDYPVLYMHDGQNIFDDVTSYAGEWGVDESAECLAARGLKCIIVGIPNGAEARLIWHFCSATLNRLLTRAFAPQGYEVKRVSRVRLWVVW
jgi:enterochelin esterase-like enzyme